MHLQALAVVLRRGHLLDQGWVRGARRDMKVTESSESVLAGTKRPPFRLVCRALSMHGTRLPVQPAVSEEFVVRLPGHLRGSATQAIRKEQFVEFGLTSCDLGCDLGKVNLLTMLFNLGVRFAKDQSLL